MNIFEEGQITDMEITAFLCPITAQDCVDCVRLFGVIASKRSRDFAMRRLWDEAMRATGGELPDWARLDEILDRMNGGIPDEQVH